MAKDSEKVYTRDLSLYLSRKLKDVLNKFSLSVFSHEKILSDVTCESYYNKKNERIEAWPTLSFLEQDIIIGSIAATPEPIVQFLRNIKNKEKIIIPRIIIEVKYSGVNSHTLMTYSEIASRMKGVYRNLRYYFLIRCGSKDPWTLERHGRSFDRIYQLERAKGTYSKVWPGYYKTGDLNNDLKKKIIRHNINQFTEDITSDLNNPKVLSPEPV